MQAANLPQPPLPIQGLKELEELNPSIFKVAGQNKIFWPHFLPARLCVGEGWMLKKKTHTK